MWWMADAGRTTLAVLAVLEAVWLLAVLALIVLPDMWHRHTARPASVPVRMPDDSERKAA